MSCESDTHHLLEFTWRLNTYLQEDLRVDGDQASEEGQEPEVEYHHGDPGSLHAQNLHQQWNRELKTVLLNGYYDI